MKNRIFKIVTLGCKVNQYESAAIEESLSAEGWKRALPGDLPDLTVINTCIVTQRASYQSRQAVRKAVREKGKGIVAVTGCYPQVFPEEIKCLDGVDIITGNPGKTGITGLLKNDGLPFQKQCEIASFSRNMPFEYMPVSEFSDRTRATLKIQEGCESFCSYCIVPYARGPLRSLPSDRVMESLRAFFDRGYREAVLTGIHLGKYGVDLDRGENLEKLLERILTGIPGLRIRLSSLEPVEITDGIIDMMASGEGLCRYFHISLQSGDSGILEKMNRRYTPDDFARIVESIHDRVPMAAIGVDIIAGFPGEDEEAFRNSYKLISGLPVSYLHVFPFSVRKGTPAAKYPDQVNSGIIKERAAVLRALGREKRMKFYESCLNNNFFVLAEGWHSKEKMLVKGLSDNYLPFVFPFDHPVRNQMIMLTAQRIENENIAGLPVLKE